MKIPWILTILFLTICCVRNSNKITQVRDNDIDSILVEPEKLPYFKGGESALLEFIDNHLNKSIVGDTNLKAGKVIISFIVDTTGKLGDFKIEKSYNKYIDKEFMRVLKSMPNWVPGEFCLNNMKGPWKKTSFKYVMPLIIPYKNSNTHK